MNEPKISIIVPVYNTEKYLRTCLDSIMAQTFTDFEAILVDDGSTDSSGIICDEYAAKDNRFVVVHKQNEGVAKARITAFENSKGELITFIDSDDYVAPEYIEKLSEPIIQKGFDMVSCDYYIEDNKKIKEHPAKIAGSFDKQGISDFIANHYFYDEKCRGFGMAVFLVLKMIKREYVEAALHKGLGLWFGEDQISVFAMLQQINSLCLIHDRLYYYVLHMGQATKKYDYSLWNSVITMLERYKDMDSTNIAQKGIRIRTWLYINKNIFQKMLPKGIDMHTFSDHMSKVRETPYMQEFFKPSSISFGFKENVRYWMLKLRFFRLFYFVYNRKK